MAAIATLQPDKNQVLISSKLYLYGSEANQEIGERIIEEINRMYNEPNAIVNVARKLLRVVFDISYELFSWASAWEMAAANADLNIILSELKMKMS